MSILIAIDPCMSFGVSLIQLLVISPLKVPLMQTAMRLSFGLVLCFLSSVIGGCSQTVDKAAVEKKVKANVAAASAEWKDIKYEGKLDGTITTAGANRTVSGHPCWFSFTGHDGEGGVAVSEGGKWLVKYGYNGGKEMSAEKMDGTDEDLHTFRAAAAEFGAACIKACP